MRCLLRFLVTVLGDDSQLIAVGNAAVAVHRTGTTVEPVMWDAPTGGTQVHNSLHSGANGVVVAWLDAAEACDVDLVISDNGGLATLAGMSDPIPFATFVETPVRASCC